MSQSIPPNLQKEKQKETKATQLQRNYCLFMDGSKYNRNIACKRHDNAYGIKGGGGESDRKKADKEFFEHLKAHKDPLAWIAFLGVRFYGWLFFNYQKTMPWQGQLLKKIFPRWFKH